MRKFKIKNAVNMMSQLVRCDEADLERRITAAAPADEALDAWLLKLKEEAYRTAMKRSRLTSQFLLSVHRFDGELPVVPGADDWPHQGLTGIG